MTDTAPTPPAGPPSPDCGSCAYFRPDPLPNYPDAGECHRWAPSPLTVAADGAPALARMPLVLWPRTLAGAWCGEYERAGRV